MVILEEYSSIPNKEGQEGEIVARIWQLLDGQHSVKEVAKQVAEEFEIDLVQAVQTVQKLVN